ncbi:PE-PGRS family protein [Streptomyces sp. NPDC041068]|uniref:PE-PGRS family protein n=1 Tax=Streptomyces sp. NPDC041068 TaxID=3155130 RepID=UPI0033F31D9B
MTGGRGELAESLRRAGLEVVGDGRFERVLPAGAAWRMVGSGEAEPAVVVREEAAGLNTRWHRLAVSHGIIGEDGAFLIDVAIDVAGDWTGCGPRRWTRVRLTDRWDLAGVLGERERPGRPEFITISADGNALIEVTVEKGEARFVVLDRIPEQREAAARAADQETPAEREAAWTALLDGPAPSERLSEIWAKGLARNPNLPDDLRVVLLKQSRSYALMVRPLPMAVIEELIVHPDWTMRGLVADAQPNVTPEQWARLILDEPDDRRRWVLTTTAVDRGAELTDAACEELAADPSARIRAEVVGLRGLPVHVLTALADDTDSVVRASACRRAWPHLEGPARTALLGDSDSNVRTEALLEHHQDHPMPRPVFASADFKGGWGLEERAVRTCRLERELAEHLARHGASTQRRSLAGNPHLDPDLVALLAEDPEEDVRFEVSTRPDLTEEQRADIDIDFDPGVHRHALDWVVALHEEPDAMRRLAASSHPLVRRSVARARRLPPDAVERLARDEDRVVQLFLAESCDDAPADMLLRVWQWWTGSLSTPDRPRSHPNFPRHNLLRYADDANPRMRRLALDDPESTADLVERLSRDGDKEVRYRAATDPRLTPASAVRLLDDPNGGVRYAASRHPRLPARVLVRMLRDVDTDTDITEAAAQHPSLPVPVMEQMLRWGAPLGHPVLDL